jgi:hypothetical protein
MAAPIVNPPLIAGPPAVSTRETWLAGLNAAFGDSWDQMHLLAARGLITALTVSGTGTNLVATTPASHADAPVLIGTVYAFTAPSGNTGPVTLSINGEPARDVLNEDGNPLAAGEIVNNRWVLLRRAGASETPHYRLLYSKSNRWGDLSQVGIIPCGGEAGTGNDFTAVSVVAVRNYLVKTTGMVYRVRFPRSNTGPMTLSIDGEDPIPVYDADNNACIAGEVKGRRRYLLVYGVSGTTGPQYNLMTDVTGREIQQFLAGGGGGGSGDAEPRAEVMGYLDGSTLRGIGDADGVVANLGSLTVLSPVTGGRFVGVIANRPSLGPNTLLGGYPGYGLMLPAAPKVLHVVIGLGQSLAIGAESSSSLVTLSQPWPDDALMFDRAVNADVRMGLTHDGSGNALALDPEDLTGFRTHVARVSPTPGDRGETMMEGFAKRLTNLAREMNIQHRTLSFTAGLGATPYSGLQKGTQTYANMLAALARAKDLAEARGWRIIVDGCLHKHGESDSGNSAYATRLAEWQADVDEDVKAITGQAADVHFFMHQPSSAWSATDSIRAMVAAQSGVIHLCGPDYPYKDAYSPDFTHMLGPGYHLIGETLARAWVDQFWRPTPRKTCVQMTAASRSGTIVTLTYDVPTAPLTIDTIAMSNPGQWGFRFFAGATEIAITAATVTDTGAGDGVGAIQLSLASAPAGGAERVDYALTLQSDPRTLANVLRGNVRDSAPETSLYDGRRLYRWAVHQRITL